MNFSIIKIDLASCSAYLASCSRLFFKTKKARTAGPNGVGRRIGHKIRCGGFGAAFRLFQCQWLVSLRPLQWRRRNVSPTLFLGWRLHHVSRVSLVFLRFFHGTRAITELIKMLTWLKNSNHLAHPSATNQVTIWHRSPAKATTNWRNSREPLWPVIKRPKERQKSADWCATNWNIRQRSAEQR